MASFFEKLKKGMGVEAVAQKEEEFIQKPKKKRQIKTVSLEIEPPQALKIETTLIKTTPIEVNPEPIKEIDKPSFAKTTESKKDWFEEPAGQLAIDVFQTERDLIIQTAIAGIKPENLEVTVERDIVAIRGIRQKPSEENGDYFAKECYWGPFTREVILPVEIDPDRVKAMMQEGILTVKMPKILREKKRIITVNV